MPDIDPDNLMSQPGISDTVRFLLAELYSNLIVSEMSRLVRAVLCLDLCWNASLRSHDTVSDQHLRISRAATNNIVEVIGLDSSCHW